MMLTGQPLLLGPVDAADHPLLLGPVDAADQPLLLGPVDACRPTCLPAGIGGHQQAVAA